MKPFDTKGEYTPDEVKAALAGIDGTRQLSFRYERLDKNNAFIEELDYVQSCSIENNSLADIKRTAKLDILDTGRMNYLQDRIKPYIRLTMPTEVRYADVIESLAPTVWWKMDDASVTPAVAGTVTVADGNTFNTMATADLIDLNVNNARKANIVTGSGTLRSEYWAYLPVTAGKSFQIELRNTGAQTIVYETYSAPDVNSPATLVRTDVVPNGRDFTYGFVFPTVGVYAIRAIAQSATVANVDFTVYRSTRFEDSTGNGINALGSGLTMRGSAVLPDGGSSWSLLNDYKSVVVDTINIPLFNGLSMNFWHTHAANGNEVSLQWGVQSGYFQYYFSDDADSTLGKYVAKFEFHSYDTAIYPNFNGTVALPSTIFDKNTPNMVTLSVTSTEAVFYVNGAKVGPIVDPGVQFSAVSNVLATEYLSYGFMGVYSYGQSYVDDFTLYPTAISLSDATRMFQYGTQAARNRTGYVEWPQGVFVLSSPTRKMVDGNTVVREVEGYDQLVVLKEDSYDYRYSVAAGTKYTDAVAKVLNYRTPANYPIVGDTSDTGASAWFVSPVTTVTSESSLSIPTSASVTEASVRTPMDVDSASVAAKLTIPSAGQMEMALSFTYDRNDYGKYSLMTGTTTLDATYAPYSGAPLTTLKSIPYDSVKHAYWRVRESNGTVYFEVSDTGSMWTSVTSTPHTYTSKATSAISFFSYAGGTGNIIVQNILAAYTTNVNKNITDSPKTLPTAMEWEPGTSKLSIINDLLGAVNYTSATYNEDGIFVARPYVSPADRTPEFTYATDASSVIVGDVSQTVDLFAVPNKWVVVVSDPDRPALIGSYTNSSPNSPTSTVSRGRTIVDYRTEQSAPDQLTLDAQASRLAFEASQIYEAVEFETALMPIHETADVYYVDIEGLVIDNKYSEQSWSMELKSGATMSHKIRRIVAI